MEPFLDNRDNKEKNREQSSRRSERIERMRQEKRRQERQRRMMKKLLPLGGALGVLIIIIVAVVVPGKKSDVNDKQVKEKTEKNVAQTSGSEPVEIAEEEMAAVETGTQEKKTTPPIYNFESTADTITINSENMLSSHAILVNENTDTIVAAKGEKERISPASMTKVLTVLVAAEHIKEEDLDDTFTMTLEVTDYAYTNDCSSVGFLDGEKVKVRDLFYGTILPSGGDAAVGLATYVAGSHEAFVDLMNKKLEELGLSDSAHFTNCVGIYDENHYCTVYDMAVIMKAAVQNELCKKVLSAHTYTTTPTTEHPEGIIISNWFLRRIEDKDTGGQVLCAKTGYVAQSQSCAVSYGTFAGETPYICVTAGSYSSWRCIYDHVEIYNQYVTSE
ncbi:MAG: D-alanyl-D-alanine carboxypeptidase [Lachnospiraceae bacterium]|nr:D-alanyl-D-alanine carboxypeptidase [Lachnospiraceae bacterium]